ncbi:MAG: Crp/Fnr family transcriptional regulator [Bacteroidetes bacterium]|nr:Crp/Fnr family transcriptional regulator [Bacteroidota bacterium]
MNQLHLFFQQNGFSDSDISRISAKFAGRSFKKGDFFLSEGKIQTEIGFILSGWFDFFTLTRDGKELTTYFAGPGLFIASLTSLLRSEPARESIRAVNPAELLVISRADFFALMEELPAFEKLYLSLLEYQLGCIESSRFDLITLSPAERYEKLLATEPNLLQVIPVQQLASMLGITPRHLSRIRKPAK